MADACNPAYDVHQLAIMYLITSSAPAKTRHPRNRTLGNHGNGSPYSALRPANLTTLAHFSVSSATSLPKSAGEPVNISLPRSAIRPFTAVSASVALISLLSLSTISAGVPLGTPKPSQPVTV